MSRRPEDTGSWPLAFFPAAALVVFFIIPFAIMLAVSFFKRIEAGFFEPTFDLANYLRFLSPGFDTWSCMSARNTRWRCRKSRRCGGPP